MTTQEAIASVLETRTKYRVSQDLGCAPILVTYWTKDTKMGAQYRDTFNVVYGIKIDDNAMGPSSNNS